MRSVGVVTVARSDWGIYRPVLAALARRDEVEVGVFAGGAHLLDRFGGTIAEVEADGYPILERVGFLDDDDSPAGAARALGRGVAAFADAFDRSRPDLLLLLGDRLEMVAAGLAALPLSLPVAHIHGGELTEGAIDDALRHALTKLSHLHFPATEAYGRRIVQLGEEPWRVTVSGAPSLDAVAAFEPLGDEELTALGVRLERPALLVTYHPPTLTPAAASAELEAVLGAVERSGLDVVVTYPGADAGSHAVIERLERYAAGERVTLVRSLGSAAYLTLLGRVEAMVGNSSSGLIEAASFGLPVVDVGRRQQGRIRPANVIHADGDANVVEAALARALSPEFRRGLEGLVNPYGDGRASERIAERLATVALDDRLLVKRFHDLDG